MRLSRRTLLAAAAGGFASSVVAPSLAATSYEAAVAYSEERRGVSLVVMQAGRILHEAYAARSGPENAYELASGTKSFTGIMAAAAAADGLLSIDEPASKTLPEWRNDKRARITIADLLTLSSGIEGGGIGRPPTYAAAIDAQPAVAPGTQFSYGPTPFQIFGEILRRKLAARGEAGDPVAYLERRVLTPIGVKVGGWRRGSDNLPFMPQGAQFTARNWAKFGQFVLDGGAGLDGPTLAANFAPRSTNPGYGMSWWLLRPGLIPPARAAGVEGVTGEYADEDIVMAAGAGDQRLYLCRKRGVVIARQADQILRGMMGRGARWNDVEFLKLVFGM